MSQWVLVELLIGVWTLLGYLQHMEVLSSNCRLLENPQKGGACWGSHETPFQNRMLTPVGSYRGTFKMEMIMPNPRKQLKYNSLFREIPVYSSHSWLFTLWYSDKVSLDWSPMRPHTLSGHSGSCPVPANHIGMAPEVVCMGRNLNFCGSPSPHTCHPCQSWVFPHWLIGSCLLPQTLAGQRPHCHSRWKKHLYRGQIRVNLYPEPQGSLQKECYF